MGSNGAYVVDRLVGSAVRERRVSIGMTQRQLAEQVGISAHQLASYEKGIARPSPGRLLAIAQALSATADVFTVHYEQRPSLN